jgi:hypothetical protein
MDYHQLEMACDIIEHYHREHTADTITRIRGGDGDGVDIYVTADPEWKRKLLELTQEECPVVHGGPI